jgi:hypothetical protein
MKVEEKLDALRASDDSDRSKLPAGERPAWWVDKEEAAKRTSSPKSPLQKAVSRAMRDVVMVRATDDCITKQPGMLSFLSGEVFAVLAKPSKTYWKGQHKGKIGRFPAAKVEPIADTDPAALYSAGVSPSAEALAQLSPRSRLEAKTLQFFRVRAIADYLPASGGAHLRFSEGESFCVLSRETPDWWKGQHKGRIGRFPRDHVVEIDEAGDEIAPRPQVGEVPLTGSPSHRGGKLFDDDISREDESSTSHTSHTNDSSKPLNDSDKKRKKKKRETIAFISSSNSSLAIDSSGAPTSPPVSARASGVASPTSASPRNASPRATSPRATSPRATPSEVTSPAITSTRSSKRASSPAAGSMMYRRALAGVEEAQRKLTTAVGEEEAANDTLRGLHAVVVSNDASCLAFQRQIESLEQEIKSKKVSKRERERMNGVLDGIKVEYDDQRGKQSTLQRQVDEATARADAARFAGVEARRLFETRTLELQRIIDREGRRGGLAQSAPVDAPLSPVAPAEPAAVAADANSSYSAAVRQALNRTSPTRARTSSKGDVRVSADLPQVSAADSKAVTDAPVRVGSWVRAKIPLEPSAAVIAASGLAAASVAVDSSNGPPPLPPMENVVQDSPNGTLLRPPRLMNDDDDDEAEDDDTTEEQ